MGRKLAALLILFTVSGIGAFATLGDGKGKNKPMKLLSEKTSLKPGSFSLQSGYNFRGSQVINFQEARYINLNTVVTYQQGHTTYVMPLKKKVSLNLTTQNKVSSATVKIKF